jgi:RimJ/RimL family protein N-acetyltransferase
LLLRRWRDDDREPFARMNADPEVMEHFPAPLTREQSDTMIDRVEAHFEERGFGLWALEVTRTGEFIGLTGLSTPRFEAHFREACERMRNHLLPAVEIGWRLARPAWGHGYATEAARRALRIAFSDAGLTEVVSFTTVGNLRSRAVMERIGLTRDPAGDFDHPIIPPGHPRRPHVLYRLKAEHWEP